jgi:hypothetical protein
LEEYTARWKAETARLKHVYCDLLKLWRTCSFKPCRKARVCRGDHHVCLQKSIPLIPRHTQFKARQRILTGPPETTCPAARTVRQFMPYDLFKGRE